MVEEVEVDNLIDKAIIEALNKAEKRMLPRKTIIKIVRGRIGKNDSVIAKRIEKMSKEPYNYFIKIGKKKSGIYKLNSDIKFAFIGEPLPPEVPKTKPTEVSLKAREEHTEDLKKAIRNWNENLPEVPYIEDSRDFFEAVDKCEHYPLFKDLSNHLSESGYDICQRWEKIKEGVKEEDKIKEELLNQIERDISCVFKGLNLRFVRHNRNLRDYECFLPFLIFESVIYSRIGEIKVFRMYKDISYEDEEQAEFATELDGCRYHFKMTMVRISDMIIFEKEDSAIWGETEEMIRRSLYPERLECIRVPISDIDTLRKGKDEIISILEKSNPEIEKSIDKIIAEVTQLEMQRDYLRDELLDSLHCKIFLGYCRYLGVV